MTRSGLLAFRLLNRATLSVTMAVRPVSAQVASDALADVSEAVLHLGRSLSTGTQDSLVNLIMTLRKDIQ